jgi:hypothetical protein
VTAVGPGGEKFAGGHEGVQGGALQDDPGATSDCPGVAGDVGASDVGGAPGGAEHRGKHTDGGALAGAVGAEQSVDLSRAHFQVEPVHRGAVREVPAEPRGTDGWGGDVLHTQNLPTDR